MRAPHPSQQPSASRLSSGTMGGPTPTPTPESLRQMMAQAAASAAAATSATGSSLLHGSSGGSGGYSDPILRRAGVAGGVGGGRSTTGRKHSSINQIPSSIPTEDPNEMRNGQLPTTKDGYRMQRILQVAAELKKSYVHPIDSSQIETETLHQLRAILFMNRTFVTQSFVSHVTAVSQGSLSHYVRGLFKGNQPNVDQKIANFVRQFAAGELDSYLDEIRTGVRPANLPLYFPLGQNNNNNNNNNSNNKQPQQQQPLPIQIIPSNSMKDSAANKSTVVTPVAPPQPPQLQPAPWEQKTVQPTPKVLPIGPSNETPVDIASATEQAAQRVFAEISGSASKQSLPPQVPQQERESIQQTPQRQQEATNESENMAASTPGESSDHDHGYQTRRSKRLSEQQQFPQDPNILYIPKPAQQQQQRQKQEQYQKQQLQQQQQKQQQQQQQEKGGIRFPHVPTNTDLRSITSVEAVEKAFHSIVRSEWTNDMIRHEPLLIPIEIYVVKEGYVMHTYTQWDVNEKELSPEIAADRLRHSRGLPKSFTADIALQIRRALFEAGVPCCSPPNSTENRRILSIRTKAYSDGIEWDIANNMNCPDLFVQQLCHDENIPSKHLNTLAKALRWKLTLAQAISYGDEATKQLALDYLEPNDPLRFPPLSTVQSALTKCTPEEQKKNERFGLEQYIKNHFIHSLIDQSIQSSIERQEMMIRLTEEMKETKEKNETIESRSNGAAKKVEAIKSTDEQEEESCGNDQLECAAQSTEDIEEKKKSEEIEQSKSADEPKEIEDGEVAETEKEAGEIEESLKPDEIDDKQQTNEDVGPEKTDENVQTEKERDQEADKQKEMTEAEVEGEIEKVEKPRETEGKVEATKDGKEITKDATDVSEVPQPEQIKMENKRNLRDEATLIFEYARLRSSLIRNFTRDKIEYDKNRLLALHDADLVYEQIHIDFRPYMELSVSRGQHPGVWIIPAIDRKRRKHLVFPMIGHYRKLKRKREDRDEFSQLIRSFKEKDIDQHMEPLLYDDFVGDIEGERVMLKLRIKYPNFRPDMMDIESPNIQKKHRLS